MRRIDMTKIKEDLEDLIKKVRNQEIGKRPI